MENFNVKLLNNDLSFREAKKYVANYIYKLNNNLGYAIRHNDSYITIDENTLHEMYLHKIGDNRIVNYILESDYEYTIKHKKGRYILYTDEGTKVEPQEIQSVTYKTLYKEQLQRANELEERVNQLIDELKQYQKPVLKRTTNKKEIIYTPEDDEEEEYLSDDDEEDEEEEDDDDYIEPDDPKKMIHKGYKTIKNLEEDLLKCMCD